ncbi:alpha/beta hydrolase [Sphingomonas sp. MMS24-J45]|uniref:alpha/beta hydrolase n=1 Tax=Sphingomonas sp. MMS24-J45 TaxID=3238806 RepID=UPI00384F218E
MDLGSDAPFEKPQPIVVMVKGDQPLAVDVERVELDLSKFHNGRWALQLDAAFARRDAPVVLLARGVACLAVTWWAQLSPRSYLRAVSGALLDSPLNIGFEQASIAAIVRTGPTYRLPFPSVVLNDGLFQVEEVLALADRWGSRFIGADGTATEHPSNRHALFPDSEAMLLEYRALLHIGAKTPQYSAVSAEPSPPFAASD